MSIMLVYKISPIIGVSGGDLSLGTPVTDNNMSKEEILNNIIERCEEQSKIIEEIKELLEKLLKIYEQNK